MALTTAAAILGGSLIAGGASLAASSSAADEAADASQYATDQNIALQREILDTVQQNTATSRTIGNAAMTVLAQRYGLTLPEVQAAARAVGVEVPQDNSTNAPGFGGNTSAGNWSAYLAADPGIAQQYATLSQGWKQANGVNSLEDFAQWHWNNVGQAEQGRLNPYTGVRVGEAAPTPAPAPAVETPTQTAQTAQPDTTPAPTTGAASIDSQGYYTAPRPEVTAAPTYVAPTYRETPVAPLDVSLDAYQKSPDYEFQLEEGNRNILAHASAASGGIENGAALKALQEWGQNLAMGDYSQWRDYTTGQYNQDRAYTANRDDAYNAFGLQNAQFGFNAAQSNYQYGTNLAQNIFNSDRDYATSRYDANTNALFNLANMGQGATTNYNNALSSSAANQGSAYFTNATNQGNSALAQAGQFNQFLGNAMNALAFSYGGQNQTGSYNPTALQGTSTNALTYGYA